MRKKLKTTLNVVWWSLAILGSISIAIFFILRHNNVIAYDNFTMLAVSSVVMGVGCTVIAFFQQVVLRDKDKK